MRHHPRADFTDNGSMSRHQNPDARNSGKRPRPDDLRNLRRDTLVDSPVNRPRIGGAAPEEASDDFRGDYASEGWVVPGQAADVPSQRDWVEPSDGNGADHASNDETTWRQSLFGDQQSKALEGAGGPPNHLKRFIAYLIDSIIILVLLSLAYPALLNRPYVDIEEIRELVELSFSGTGTVEPVTPSTQDAGGSFSFLLLTVSTSTLLNLMAYVLYHGVLLGLSGTTVGKRLMGIVVYNTDGRPVGILRGIVRSLGVFVTTTFGSIGFIFVLFHPRRRALHDLLAGSYPIEPRGRFQPADYDQ